jgi:hypothetical protein
MDARAFVSGLRPEDLDAGADLSELVNFRENDLVGMARGLHDDGSSKETLADMARGLHDDGSSKETLADMIATVVVRSFTLLYITLVIFTTRSCT